MPRKPNYSFERREREKAQAQKKAERQRAKQERSEERKKTDAEQKGIVRLNRLEGLG
jgi:hypothetical protein